MCRKCPSKLDRLALYRRIMARYPYVLANHYDSRPKLDFNFNVEVLHRRYGVGKLGMLTMEQLTDLVHYMEDLTKDTYDDGLDAHSDECDCHACTGATSASGAW